MRAALLKAPHEMTIAQVPDAKCPPQGLLVKMEACSICATDVKMFYNGQRDLVYPRILGHEIAGVVAETSTDIFKRGNRVQIAPGLSCGKCPACQRGATNQCDHIGIFGFTHNGGFAQYLAVPPESLRCGGVNLIPDELTFEEATFAEPLACCLNGQKQVHLGSEDTMLVFGAGPIGCLHTMLAHSKGVKQVLLAEKHPERLKMAANAGAERLIDVSRESLREIVKEGTKGQGVDVIILACPDSALEYPLLELLAPRGRICFFSGLPAERNQILLDANLLHYRELTLVGAYGCTAKQNRLALDLMASRHVDVKWLITKRIPLKELREELQHSGEHRGMKVAVTEF